MCSPYLSKEATKLRVEALGRRLADDYHRTQRGQTPTSAAWLDNQRLFDLALAFAVDPDDESGLLSLTVRQSCP